MNKKILSLLAGVCCFSFVSCNKDNGGGKGNHDELALFDNVLIAVNEDYNVAKILKEEYLFAESVSFEVKDEEVARLEQHCHLIGNKVGETIVTITVNYNLKQDIKVSVQEEAYVAENLRLDYGRLFEKKAVFFGDSITDTNHRPTEQDNKKYGETYDYYPELIQKMVPMQTVNYSYSGATTGLSMTSGLGTWFQNYGTDQVVKATEDLKTASYAFILLGTNDFMRWTELGTLDDMPTGTSDALTYAGAYQFMIQHIKKCNPNIRIVAISVPFATWGRFGEKPENGVNLGTSRADFNNVLIQLAQKHHLKYVDITQLFNQENYPDMIPDGIHPAKDGQQAIANAILNI